MPKLKDFIINLAKKAGMDTENAVGKGFFESIPDSDIPEDVQKGIDNSLISITDAKNNHPDLKNHYHKQVFDALDKNYKPIFDEYPELVDDEEVKSTKGYKLPVLIANKIAELSAKKAAATSGKDKTAIQKEIDDLHKAVAAEKKARDEDKKSFDNQMTSYKINSKINQYMSGFKTIHDELDPEVKSTVINTLLQKELQDNQAKFAFDEQGNFTLLKNDGTNFYGENHQQISPVKFIEQTLAKTKQLKVSSPAPNGATPRVYPSPNGNGQPDKNPNAAVIELNNQALEQIKAAANSR